MLVKWDHLTNNRDIKNSCNHHLEIFMAFHYTDWFIGNHFMASLCSIIPKKKRQQITKNPNKYHGYTVRGGHPIVLEWKILETTTYTYIVSMSKPLVQLTPTDPIVNENSFETTTFFSFLCHTIGQLPSLKLTVRTWKVTQPQKESSLPTTFFQGRAVKLRGVTPTENHHHLDESAWIFWSAATMRSSCALIFSNCPSLDGRNVEGPTFQGWVHEGFCIKENPYTPEI